ncbi:RNA polymerase sigma factor [Rubripirellula reticaptiva]|uniref:RNA polymerase sigma factor n=1 Tax=Rubripirellula reticaptiva TaxID=2528013 RepID=A0A5C6EPD6_9BACT|nr:sigma-70 family RNA polymerase sigma factor [Rubripirellula reticaptiva]TWU51623.1 RNA polymerase sigma factor [Rubripirellula reticaptiva]
MTSNESASDAEKSFDAIDAKLIAEIKQHDSESLGHYIERHRTQLIGFLRSITTARLLSAVELDDLLQEVATSAVSSLNTAPLDQYEPMQWLQQVARRRVVDAHRYYFGAQRRDSRRQQSLHAPNGGGDQDMGLEQLLAASMTSPSAAFSQDVRLNRMQLAIASLNDEQKSVIRMRYADGLATKQIAEQLGKTDVAIRVLLSRSMRQLEKLLEDVKPTR